jgi:hypothetical protein
VTRTNFDRIGGLVLACVFGFSVGVGVAVWQWFPTEAWGDIAHIPPTALNDAALLLPWVALFVFSLLRRRCLRPPS